MSYVLIENNQVKKYPYSIGQFRDENPNVSLPVSPTVEQLNEVGIFPVTILEKPVFNETTEKCIENVTPSLIDGVWTVNWTVSDKTNEEIQFENVAKRSSMVVSAFQAKAALLQAGLLTDVENYINNPDTDPLVKLAWNNAIEFRRLSPIITVLGSTFNLSEIQLDKLFKTAKSIEI